MKTARMRYWLAIPAILLMGAGLPARKNEKPLPPGKNAADVLTGKDVNQIVDFVSALDVAVQHASVADSSTVLASGTSAARRLDERFADTIRVKDHGAKCDATWNGAAWVGTDDTAAIQAALNAAGAITPTPDDPPAGMFNQRRSGAIVELPKGACKVCNLILPRNTGLAGQGPYSTILVGTCGGSIIRNADNVDDGGPYDLTGFSLRDFMVMGDRTQATQIGIDLLRPDTGHFQNVVVYGTGGTGWRIRQALSSLFENVAAFRNVGPGFALGSGVESFQNSEPNNLPSNNNIFSNIHSAANDGPGFLFDPQYWCPPATCPEKFQWGITNGNRITGAFEYNYLATADHTTGHQIELRAGGVNPDDLDEVWTEGPGLSHVLIETAESAFVPVYISKWRHYGNDVAGNVDRALIVNRGSVYINRAFGHGGTYRTHPITGSISPFRVNKGNGAHIWATECVGSTITDVRQLVEDENGAQMGYENNVQVRNQGDFYSRQRIYADNGSPVLAAFTGTKAHPWLDLRNWEQGIGFGSGDAEPDVVLRRSGANTLTVGDGDFLQLGSNWQTGQFLLGWYRVWIDADGRVRVKDSAPASDTDGNAIGFRSAAQADSAAVDVAALRSDFNSLLAKMRASGLLAP